MKKKSEMEKVLAGLTRVIAQAAPMSSLEAGECAAKIVQEMSLHANSYWKGNHARECVVKQIIYESIGRSHYTMAVFEYLSGCYTGGWLLSENS
jgi:hypothetical protein